MAKVPASFIKNYIAQHGTNNKFAQAVAPPPAPAKAKPKAKPQPKPKAQPRPKALPRRKPAPRKKPGLFRKIIGAIAGEALKNTGVVGKHISKRISEDAMGSGGVPTNCASSGAISGLGAPGSDEPGVKKKSRNKSPILSYKMFKRTKGLQT